MSNKCTSTLTYTNTLTYTHCHTYTCPPITDLELRHSADFVVCVSILFFGLGKSKLMKILIHTISCDNFKSAAAVAVTDGVLGRGGDSVVVRGVGRGITFDVSIIPALALTKSCWLYSTRSSMNKCLIYAECVAHKHVLLWCVCVCIYVCLWHVHVCNLWFLLSCHMHCQFRCYNCQLKPFD